jgi:ATP-dependent Lhr-like helicase
VLVLAATDPAQPYGAALAWPERPESSARVSRSAGAFVVLVDGECAAYVERGGKALATFPALAALGTDDSPTIDRVAEGLVEAHKQGRLPRVQIERIDDEPARVSPHAEALRAAGFADGYKGLTLR